jgi:Leucine-rich repeat (LRR) protein
MIFIINHMNKKQLESIINRTIQRILNEETGKSYENIAHLPKYAQAYIKNIVKRKLDGFHLHSNDASLSEIEFMKDMKWLEDVNFYNHRNLSDITPLGELPKLKHINLVGTAIRDIKALAKCKNLEVVQIDFTNVSDITPLKDLPKLKQIYAGNTKIRDISSIRDKIDAFTLKFYGDVPMF